MRKAVIGAALGVQCSYFLLLATEIWHVAAVMTVGLICTWLYAPPRPSLGKRGPDQGYFPACYDYGGCQWRGDGCAGRPVVLGLALRKGCVHNLAEH